MTNLQKNYDEAVDEYRTEKEKVRAEIDSLDCSTCWSVEEHDAGFCREGAGAEIEKTQRRVSDEDEVSWKVASVKQRIYLVALSFQKTVRADEKEAFVSLATSETAPSAGVSSFIDDLRSRRWRSDCFIGRVDTDDLVSGVVTRADAAGAAELAVERFRAREVEAIAEKKVEVEEKTETGSEVDGTVEVRDGYYTIELDDGERRTLRIRTKDARSSMEGKRAISYLAGPQNESDYEGFGFVEGSTVLLWKRYRDDSTLSKTVEVLFEDPGSAAKGYAMESKNCYVCGRTLTTPESIVSGIGPVCEANGGAY